MLLQEVVTADKGQQGEQAYCMPCLGHNKEMTKAHASGHAWYTADSAQGTAAPISQLSHRAVQEVVTAEVDDRKEQVHCVLCLGHNKGMEEAATSLAVGPFSLQQSQL